MILAKFMFHGSKISQVTLVISIISSLKFTDTRKMLKIINKPSKNIFILWS